MSNAIKNFFGDISLYNLMDGEPGQPGPPGKDGNSNIYQLNTNYNEIVKFFNQNDNSFNYSPEKLIVECVNLGTNYKPNEDELKASLFTSNSSFSIIDSFVWNEDSKAYEFSGIGGFLTQIPTNEQVAIKLTLFAPNTEEVSSQKIIAIKPGSSEDIAKLALNSSGLIAAIQGTNLEFNANGLHLTRLKEDKKETVFEADENGNLTIVGTIMAENGRFNGEVTATSGKVGGLILKEGYMFSHYDNYQDIDDYDVISKNSALVINGNDGKILANNILLGEGAVIDSFIKLGRAKIQNPDFKKNDSEITSNFIEVTNEDETKKILTISDSGLIEINDGASNKISLGLDTTRNVAAPYLSLQGVNSRIEGNNFIITPDYAMFNNIFCSGKIQTAIFEKHKVQSVGGSMIFKQAIQIEQIILEENYYKIIFKESILDTIKIGDILWMVDTPSNIIEDNSPNANILQGNCKISYIINENDQLPSENSTDEEKRTIKLVYREESMTQTNFGSAIIINGENDLIIGINSQTGSICPNDIILGQGLTMQSINKHNDQNDNLPWLFLGNLENLGQINQGINGYGLYSKNVFLTGSLTTKAGEESYAGVNTLGGVPALEKTFPSKIVNGEEIPADTSKIIFWGGADSNSDEAIQLAPFQVTEKGSLFARHGVFEESVFTNGTIRGAKLETATIYGTGQNPGLTIYDTNQGISFRKTLTDGTDQETFNIGFDGLRLGGQLDPFIKITDTGVQFSCSYIKANKIGLDRTFLSISEKVGTDLSEEEKISLTVNDKEQMTLKEGVFGINGRFILSGIMEYREVSNGYDLYIIEKEGGENTWRM